MVRNNFQAPGKQKSQMRYFPKDTRLSDEWQTPLHLQKQVPGQMTGLTKG